MKAARYYKGEKALRVEEVPTPKPGPGQVRVKVAACGVCHTDLHYLDHGVPTFQAPPVTLGHEISGVVDALGEGVQGPAAGSPVIIPAVLTCGSCPACRAGRENICDRMVMVGNHFDGGYAEFIVVPPKDLIPVPPGLPLADCSIIADALSTPFHAVVNRGEVRPGQVVAVFGCGGVGINVVQFAALAGARVVAVDVVDAKLELARKLGASDTFNASSGQVAKAIRKSVGLCDVAFEVIGKPAVMVEAMGTLKAGGRFVIVGYSAEDMPLPASRVMFRELDIRGSLGCRPLDYHRIVDLVARGKLPLEPLVSRRYPLDQVNEAFDALRRGDPIIRSIVVMS
jgi:6-hydroxycyclohex-1-ene-1-carbonyl-CoA dehydrogenase